MKKNPTTIFIHLLRTKTIKELRREQKKKKWILMFFTYGEEEEKSLVYCEIMDSKLFIRMFNRWIIKY
jgi:hypothetical protein